MSLDNSTRTFADIEGPVDSTVPSRDYYFQRKMALQYRALRNATCNPYSETNLQTLIEHVYLQYLPYNIFLPQNQAIWEIANIGYEFCFSTFDLGHLATRDPESGKLSTFFDTPMHLAVIEHMSSGNKNYKPSSAAVVRLANGVLVAYCVHKKSEFPTSPPSPILIPTTLNFDRLRPSRRFLDVINVDDRDEDSLVTAVTPLILEVKAEGQPLIDGWIQLCGHSLSSFQACRCRWGVFQRGARFGRLMVLGEVSEEGIAIEYRDPGKDDSGDDDEPLKILKDVDELELFLKSPGGMGTLPYRLFTNSTVSANGDLDPTGVKVAHSTIQMGIDLIKTLPIDRPLCLLPDLPDSGLLSWFKVYLRDMSNHANQHFVHRFKHLSLQNETTSSMIQDENVDVADAETEDCGESYVSDWPMSIDDEEETEQEWWSMSPERMRRLKKKEDKAYVEAVRKVLREKGTPFFLLSPSQFDKLSKGAFGGPCTHA
ncbi:Hypothetical Protein CGB_G0090C [Cryptococcus gattii WM276]|uniref:Uncharacterized protein n=2 Tax=Cryptococcus gattii TaxID=37769 RepID=E6R8T4_CRYGW|nr:Hypothetical Protein CGB_G0090C [Cryptococcus gattii WM276]ADV23294.1 Hypothetical Protein CGB_G0090C [Cryptococcus gattii WM276]KIR77966.1 hypothetical protein I306_05033 [Cryptococcus gattii EJB2]